MRYNRNQHYDPLVVDALVHHFPVPGAAPADRCAAAKALAAKGYSYEQIGVRLGIGARQAQRMVLEQIVTPLPEPIKIPEDSWRNCCNGHELSPDNIYVRQRYGKPHQECVTCRRNHQNGKNTKRRAVCR